MKIRKLFSDQDVLEAINVAGTEDGVHYVRMAEHLSNNPAGVSVSPQLARYWARQFEEKKRNGEHYLTLARPNRELREGKEVRRPSRYDDVSTVEQSNDTSCILFITDDHKPYHHPDLMDFLAEVKRVYQPTMVIHGGDELDHHALSFHDSDPNLASAGHELEQSLVVIQEMRDLFPELRLCHSNHGSLVFRRAHAHGIPVQYLKTYREVLFPKGGGEGWSWHEKIRLILPNGEPVQFQHEAKGSLLQNAAHERCNLCVGHQHSHFDLEYAASNSALYWGVHGGCLLEREALAFAYGKQAKMRPILGCTVIEDSLPKLVPMLLGKGGRWVKRL